MDQTTDNHYMTREFLETQIAAFKESLDKKDALILSLQDRASQNSQREYATAAELQLMRDNMHDWTMTALQNEKIDEDIAEEIAEIIGFELTKEVEVEVTVTYNLTVQVPHNEDVDSIVNDIDFESVSYNSDNISWLTASVDRIDF